MTSPRFGMLAYPGLENLGDVIQSLAARRFLPQVDVLIIRERISHPPAVMSGPIRTILNGWFMHAPDYWPPHQMIEPLPIAMHFVEPGVSRLQRWARTPLQRMLTGAGAEYLRHWGPIGARDEWTLEQLDNHNIPAYLSGCLTLTLKCNDVIKGDYIVACDLSDAALEHLRKLTVRPIVEATHLGGETLSQNEQIEAAEQLLALYSGATAVVTSRIHAAMPCLALNTPVLLVHSANPGRRVSDIAKLTHACSEDDFLRHKHEFDLIAPPENPHMFRTFVKPLEQRCEDFVNRV